MSTLKDALLEIGSEELPASFISIGMRQLKALAEQSLKEHQLSFGEIHVYGTPRRLAVLIAQIGERSADQNKALSGPPEAIAKDAHGAWTPAALGFARKNNLKPTDLRIENGKVAATLHIKGTPARALLAELFPSWIKKLEFPKAMVWEPSKFRYPRPMRWLAAMVGADPVSFSLAGIRAARITYGLYLHSSKKLPIGSASKYVTVLKNHCVLVEPEARRDAIRKMAEQAIKRTHGRLIAHESLLDQVANLVEFPTAVMGNFDPAYLELPSEVLVTCLEHHQKYFPVQAEKGSKLLPHFVGIRNGMSVHQDIVREGYEKVLAARLADARFFFEQDRKAPLHSRVESLKRVMFQQKLGSLFDKKERVSRLIEQWAPALGLSDEEKTQALRVAELCKADLVTGMVGEFPELQGIMARLYAGADGENATVAQACEQHYWPITLIGALPETKVAAIVALADKLDTLAGDFAVGLIPTGSADPYGLRRAAVGVLRLLEKWTSSQSLEELVGSSVQAQNPAVVANATDVRTKLEGFFRQRWAALLEERGFKVDEVDAVVSGGIGRVEQSVARLDALHRIRKQKEFEPLAAAFKRAMNIVRQASKNGALPAAPVIDSTHLQEPAEKSLHAILQQVQSHVRSGLDAGDHSRALSAIVPLREPLDAFFAAVMVMAEDPALRANRLALMQTLVQLFSPIADFSKLQGGQPSAPPVTASKPHA